MFFSEKLTSQESSRAGREGSERIRNPSRGKQFTYFMAPYVFQTQCKYFNYGITPGVE